MKLRCKTHGEVDGIVDRNSNEWCPLCLDGWGKTGPQAPVVMRKRAKITRFGALTMSNKVHRPPER